jgi:hypothetical protein
VIHISVRLIISPARYISSELHTISNVNISFKCSVFEGIKKIRSLSKSNAFFFQFYLIRANGDSIWPVYGVKKAFCNIVVALKGSLFNYVSTIAIMNK